MEGWENGAPLIVHTYCIFIWALRGQTRILAPTETGPRPYLRLGKFNLFNEPILGHHWSSCRFNDWFRRASFDTAFPLHFCFVCQAERAAQKLRFYGGISTCSSMFTFQYTSPLMLTFKIRPASQLARWFASPAATQRAGLEQSSKLAARRSKAMSLLCVTSKSYICIGFPRSLSWTPYLWLIT